MVLRLLAGDISHAGTSREECLNAAFFGYFMVTLVINISFYTGECIDGIVMICAALGGMILYAAGGGICLGAHDYNFESEPNTYAVGAGAVGLVCASVYYIDFLAHLLAVLRERHSSRRSAY